MAADKHFQDQILKKNGLLGIIFSIIMILAYRSSFCIMKNSMTSIPFPLVTKTGIAVVLLLYIYIYIYTGVHNWADNALHQ